jgi:cytochrome bd ubiquinol oxidase subunit II
MRDPSFLQTLWFVLIGVLWIGYFVLEGFDFGVGMLLRHVGRDSVERRLLLHTIGPVWDGNEVWLLVAGGATFAAFPEWYASLFSGFYLALFLVLAALILRNVAFEFWGKHDSPRWRACWEWAIVGGSFVPALLWGVAWADIVGGVPLDRSGEVTASLLDLLHPYALLGGLTTLLIFLTHGAIFLALRTRGEIEARARAVARGVAPAAAVVALAFLGWTVARQDGVEAFSALCAAAAVALLGAVALLAARAPGRAFVLSCAAIALLFVALLADLWPNVLVSSTDPAFSLRVAAASSTPYTLKVMTVVAVALVPVVLIYQAWTYWVFRARLGREDFESLPAPLRRGEAPR